MGTLPESCYALVGYEEHVMEMMTGSRLDLMAN